VAEVAKRRRRFLDAIAGFASRPPPGLHAAIGVGLGFAVAGLAIRFALDPLLGQRVSFMTLFPAVIAAGIVGGRGAGFACLWFGALGSWYLLLPPRFSWEASPAASKSLLTFLVLASVSVVLVDFIRSRLVRASEATAQEELIIREMRHRVKNTLTIVQVIARQTVQASADPVSYELFLDRLEALARAQDLIVSQAAGKVGVLALIQSALAPFETPGSRRIWLRGDDVEVSLDHVTPLLLAFNELATNASKYGALSSVGWVEITSNVRPHRGSSQVELVWREHGGPKVVAPERRGFGSTLLSRQLFAGESATPELTFSPDGVTWRLIYQSPAEVVAAAAGWCARS
jgi:two-component sensor histidine kinase